MFGIFFACLTLSDGLVDCMDPDCCLQATCHTTSLCVGSPDPLDIIQETQLSSTQSKLQTFYERVRFLVGRDSTHVIPGVNPFDGKWVVCTLYIVHVCGFHPFLLHLFTATRCSTDGGGTNPKNIHQHLIFMPVPLIHLRPFPKDTAHDTQTADSRVVS